MRNLNEIYHIKSKKNHGFTLSSEDTFLEKPQKRGGGDKLTPSCFGVNMYCFPSEFDELKHNITFLVKKDQDFEYKVEPFQGQKDFKDIFNLCFLYFLLKTSWRDKTSTCN